MGVRPRVVIVNSSRAITFERVRERLVARVRVGDALWVHEHAVTYRCEIHHIAFELG